MSAFPISTDLQTTALGRPLLALPGPGELEYRHVLVTGSSGTIGQTVCAILETHGHRVSRFDLTQGPEGDVLCRRFRSRVIEARPDAILHLAADKHAPQGEQHPARVADLNIRGTSAAVEAAALLHIPIVTASTCKAADPCTAYGASKLIAERITTNYEQGAAARLVNVLGASGSVMEIWAARAAQDKPLPVATGCRRMWMLREEAALLLLACIGLDGLYGPAVPGPELVDLLCRRAYPDHPTVLVQPRRGDRPQERLVGEYETSVGYAPRPGTVRIYGPWELDA